MATRYTFFGPSLLDEQTANNLAAGAVLGGVVGAAIAGRGPARRPPVLPYEVHLASGRVAARATMPPQYRCRWPSPTVPDTARVYVYRRGESPRQPNGDAIPLASGQPAADSATRQVDRP